jgi:RHS repeat-associated protein
MTMLVTDGSGTKTHVYGYDNIYQLTDVNYPPGYDYLATDTTFNYDAAGNRTTVIDASGTTTYSTNNLNQYTAVADVNYLYDDNGNMTYDGANSYAYDPENRLVTVTKQVGDPLAVACDNESLAFTTDGDASWFAQTAVYYYDNDAAQSGPIGDSQESWLETTVEGTGTVRFWWKVSCEPNDSFAFYVDGQYIFGRSGSADWQEYPHTITTAGTHTLKWRYFKGSSGAGGSDCAWVDYVRWSGSVPDPNGWQTITYTYDPAGRRIEKKYDDVTVMRYLYDGARCIAEYDGSDNLLRKYIFGPCIDEPISMIDVEHSNATYYYHFDALGSVIALTNSSGSTVELYEYSVYGQVAASDANIPNRFMFTGREFDSDTGLYYYRARYYNPEIGRFLQTDPIGYGDGMNWYRYGCNSPLGVSDPFGLSSVYGLNLIWDSDGHFCIDTNDLGTWTVDNMDEWASTLDKFRSSYDFLTIGDNDNSVKEAFRELDQLPSGRSLLQEFGGKKSGYIINVCYNMQLWFAAGYLEDSRMVLWDPLKIKTHDGTALWMYAPPAIILAHELIHAYTQMVGIPLPSQPPVGVDPTIWKNYMENRTVGAWDPPGQPSLKYTENMLRAEYQRLNELGLLPFFSVTVMIDPSNPASGTEEIFCPLPCPEATWP